MDPAPDAAVVLAEGVVIVGAEQDCRGPKAASYPDFEADHRAIAWCLVYQQ